MGELAGLWATPPLTDKRNLEPLRLVHAVLTILLLGSVTVMLGRHVEYGLARLVALIGRQTLHGFAASIPATYLAASARAGSEGSYVAYLLACAFVLAVVIAVAFTMEARAGRVILARQASG